MLAFTGAYALFVQTLAFHRANDIHGDIAYHRGVAASMVGGDLNGQGPIHGLLSYFGGLFPMSLGYGAHAFGVSFDSFISAVSWPATLALPLALWWLGRRIWDDDLTPALLAFLGTVSGPIGNDPAARWVRSVLPSGANFWPVYPRDIGLVLVIVTVAIALRPPRFASTILAGATAALALGFQVQFGFYAMAAGGATIAWVSYRNPDRRTWVLHAGILGVTGTVASVWWWWPRLQTYRESGHLLLKSFPGNTDPPLSVAGLVGAFGLLGIFGILGLVMVARRGSKNERFFAVWFALFIPIAIGGIVLGDTGVLTGRRVLFLASLPLTVCAASAATRFARHVDLRLAVPVALIVVTVPGIVEARWIRDRVDAAWVSPAPPDPYAVPTWANTFTSLRSRVANHGSSVVLASDNDAEFIWEHTGAQPTSLWLPGWVKLGFPLRPTTGTGYLTRVRTTQAGFGSGRRGVCAEAHRYQVDRIVLRSNADGVALYDVRPSARWRVDPKNRTERSIHRSVGPALTYLDVNENELLAFGRGGHVSLDWHAPEVRAVEIEFLPRSGDVSPPPVTLRLANGTALVPEFSGRGTGRMAAHFPTPDGIPNGASIEAGGRMTINRVSGFVPLPTLLGARTRPRVLTPEALCRKST